MTPGVLIVRSVAHYRRRNMAVIAGVATAVAVLAGALLVGDSVRESLLDLVLQRLGRTDRVVVSTGLFREALAAEMAGDPGLASGEVAPLLAMRGLVSEQSGGRRAGGVQVYGVDDRFWAFHRITGRGGPAGRDAYISRALAADIGAAVDGTILVRIEKPTDIPIESLHGRKDDPGRTLRLTVRDVLDARQLGEFSIQPQQGAVRAVFVPLRRLQQDLEQSDRVNTILVAGGEGLRTSAIESALRQHARLEDFGLKLRAVPDDPLVVDARQVLAVEADAGLIDEARADAVSRAAAAAGLQARPVLTYLANAIRGRERDGQPVVPYSLVAAVDLATIVPDLPRADPAAPPPIVLNDWTAKELGLRVGDSVELDYYVWREPGYLDTMSAEFRLAAVVPIAGAAADRNLAPDYPGITEANSLGDWDPPFPIDLKRVRPVDEDYWDKYRTTPKAFVAYEAGRQLWGSPRYGDRTSIRLSPTPPEPAAGAAARLTASLLGTISLPAGGFTVIDVRAQGAQASRGSTDFGEYFVYFSFFLVVSALVLATLFFRLNVEQRAREFGLLRAVGYTTARVRRLFTAEGLYLAVIGSALGVVMAIGYGALMMQGLRTWWSGAVGTHELSLYPDPVSLAAGAAGAVATAVICIWWTLRNLSKLSERTLLSGRIGADRFAAPRSSIGLATASAALGLGALGLIGAALTRSIPPAGAFFGAGAALLGSGLCGIAVALRRPPHSVKGHGWSALVRVGVRNATERPGRSVLAIAVIASAAFIVISVDAFRRGGVDVSDPKSGTGGYPLLVQLTLPLVHDPNGRDGRETLGIPEGGGVTLTPFRLLPGDDASCLNLYAPANPRVLGAPRSFIAAARFAFHGSLAASEEDRRNPWRLLEQPQSDGTIPAIADATSLNYVLHKSLGDIVAVSHGGRQVRLKLVAALADSVLQGELIVSDANFVGAFPDQQGYRFLLVDAPAAGADGVGAAIERGAADLGADAIPTGQRLAEFHAVENTYLSTFQTLGGLGLLVGTVGLAAVLLRNVLERRRELALLRAVGYRRQHLFCIVVSENALLLVTGLVLGAAAAAIAVGPAAIERGARLPISAGGLLLLLAVLAAGLVSSLIATRAAFGAPLVASLRSE